MVPLKVCNDHFYVRKSLIKRDPGSESRFSSNSFPHFPCFFERWPLAVPSSECGAKLWEKFGVGGIQIGKSDQTPAKINIQAFLAFTQTLSLNSSSRDQLSHIFRGDSITHPSVSEPWIVLAATSIMLACELVSLLLIYRSLPWFGSSWQSSPSLSSSSSSSDLSSVRAALRYTRS